MMVGTTDTTGLFLRVQKSLHVGGVYVLMGDNSIHFISESIDQELFPEISHLYSGMPTWLRGRVTDSPILRNGLTQMVGVKRDRVSIADTEYRRIGDRRHHVREPVQRVAEKAVRRDGAICVPDAGLGPGRQGGER